MADRSNTTNTPHHDADIIAAWVTYLDASNALDGCGLKDHHPTVRDLNARIKDAMDVLIEGAPSSPAGAAAMLRFALDHLGEPAEAAAARDDTPPADDDWSSDGHRVLYRVVRALEGMGDPASP